MFRKKLMNFCNYFVIRDNYALYFYFLLSNPFKVFVYINKKCSCNIFVELLTFIHSLLCHTIRIPLRMTHYILKF